MFKLILLICILATNAFCAGTIEYDRAQQIGLSKYKLSGPLIEYLNIHTRSEDVMFDTIVPLPLQECVAQQAIYFYRKINESGKFRYPHSPAEAGMTRSDMWSCEIALYNVPLGKTEQVRCFTLKHGFRLSEGFRDLLDQGGVIDCCCALTLVTQLISSNLLGDTLFDSTLELHGVPYKTTSPKIFNVEIVLKQTPTLPGEFGHIANVPDYSTICPGGLNKGQNIFCVGANEMGEPLYLGFGGFFKTPRTENEIVDDLYQNTIKPIEAAEINHALRDTQISLHEAYTRDRALWEEKRNGVQRQLKSYRFK